MLEELLNRIQAELRAYPRIGNFNIVATIEGVRGSLADLGRTIRTPTDSGTPHRWAAENVYRSPNLTTYFHLLQTIENYYEASPEVQVELVFDSSKQFDNAFADLYAVLRDAEPRQIVMPGHHIPMSFGFRSITAFSTADSAATPILQLADYYASGVRNVFEQALLDTQPVRLNKAMTFFVRFSNTPVFKYMANLVVSDNLARRYFAFREAQSV